MRRAQRETETSFRRFFDIVMVFIYNTLVFSCVILALWFAVFLISLLLPEEDPFVRVAKIVASISVICLYVCYTVRDIILYVQRSMRKF